MVAARPWPTDPWAATNGRPLAAGRRLALLGCPHFFWNLFLSALHFLPKWSTLAGWLQHMPALPRLLLETSNTHNFWSVGPKKYDFFFPQRLLRDASLQKVSKNLKIVWAQVTLTKTGLSAVWTFSPLEVNGVNCRILGSINKVLPWAYANNVDIIKVEICFKMSIKVYNYFRLHKIIWLLWKR
jgi:hypothetical protein